MSKNCGWCGSPELQAKCINCNGDIYICHNAVDCAWSHRAGGFTCSRYKGRLAHPMNGTIEPSSTADIPKPADIKQYPAVILATNNRAGKQYADMLGIENYMIAMRESELEGLKVRAVVITPGYYEKIESIKYKTTSLMRIAMRTGMLTNTPLG